MAALSEASAAVESLRTALSAASAAEEAAQLEVAGLKKQLAAYRQEEDGRFQLQLRQQSEQMRLRLRVGELAEEVGLKEGAAACAVVDVQCLQVELQRSERRADELAADLKEQTAQSEAAMAALHAAREREGQEHRQRLAQHQQQLQALRETMASDRRVDPRMYLELLEPVYRRLSDGLSLELERSQTLGMSWGSTEAEQARAACARLEARLDEERAARHAEATRREAQHREQLEHSRESARRTTTET